MFNWGRQHLGLGSSICSTSLLSWLIIVSILGEYNCVKRWAQVLACWWWHCPLLIMFANSLEPDQARHNVGPDVDPNCLILWLYSWKNFLKKLILKKISRRQKTKITQHAKCSLLWPNCRAWSGSKLFDTLIVFLKEFFEKVNFEKNQQTTEDKNYPACQVFIAMTKLHCSPIHESYTGYSPVIRRLYAWHSGGQNGNIGIVIKENLSCNHHVETIQHAPKVSHLSTMT